MPHTELAVADCSITLTAEMAAALIELYCGLGPEPLPKAVKSVCTFEELCRISQTTKEDWERQFGQPFIRSDLKEFAAGFFAGLNAEQRRRSFAARRR